VKIAPAGDNAAPPPPVKFIFDRDKVVCVADAAAYCKRDEYTLYSCTITGTVRKPDRTLEDESSTVTIATTINGKTKNMSIELDMVDHQPAVTLTMTIILHRVTTTFASSLAQNIS